MGKDWNIDDYRAAHESEEHWMLRRQFMEVNFNRFPRIRVLSLSQVFANVEFLGCKYPPETMELVAELSQGIVEEYRQKQKMRLQRTFVKASAAAEKKSKGDATHSPSKRSSTDVRAVPYRRPLTHSFVSPCHDPNISSDIKDHTNFKQNYNDPSGSKPSVTSITSIVTNILDRSGATSHFPTPLIASASAVVQHSSKITTGANSSFNTGSLPNPDPDAETRLANDLVLVEQIYNKDSPAQILNRSCQMFHKILLVKHLPKDERGFVCAVSVGKELMVESVGLTEKDAKQNGHQIILNKLRGICYTVQIKEQLVGNSKIRKQELIGEPEIEPVPPPLDQSNIGNKLLRAMGWSGGGLGKNEYGIKDPIDVSDLIGRSRLGLGFKGSDLNHQKIIEFLKISKSTMGKEDIIFAPEFTSVERDFIHKAANTLGLKSRSYGKDEHRFLAISKRVNLFDLVREVLETGETPKYRVIKPGEHQELVLT